MRLPIPALIFVLSILSAGIGSSPASAQAYVVADCAAVTGIPTGPNQSLVIDTTGKLCGISSSAGGGTQDVNLKQVGGTTTAAGSGVVTAGTQRVVLATDVALPAGELHIGEVGQNQTTITVAQTVTASSAYVSGNALGNKITLTGLARVSAGSGLVQSVTVNIKSTQTGPMDLVIFNADPSASTCTDKTAFSVAAADFDKILGVAHLTDYTPLGTPTNFQSQNLAIPFALPSGTSGYGCLVTRSTPTFTATTDVSVSVRPIRN